MIHCPDLADLRDDPARDAWEESLSSPAHLVALQLPEVIASRLRRLPFDVLSLLCGEWHIAHPEVSRFERLAVRKRLLFEAISDFTQDDPKVWILLWRDLQLGHGGFDGCRRAFLYDDMPDLREHGALSAAFMAALDEP